ncbi:MAG: metallophosphoesterase [Gammaproteobacteria bacterium]|nr:metallophosphoesterase [Gammaproteobacteria bacterium]MDH4315655.1 metallophosphoesterase [Gammaproteobacteria bacterium]MDH5213583.1 metallophosphoesterase [Gammaproteobacteria bacterium]
MLHITDPHLFADSEGNLRGTNTRASLQAVLDHISTEAWPADLVALTGDLIQDDSRDAYKRVANMFEPLGLPVLCVPGNHDVRKYMKEQLQTPRFRYCAANRYGNWLIVGIDSCVTGQAGGTVGKDEMQRLRNLLGDTDAEHALVCLHHPPLPVGSRWLDTVGLENGDEFLDLLAACGNVRMAIFGHVHQAFDSMHAEVRIVGTPSTCRQFAVMSDEFALDDNPPAYRRLELQGNGSVKTQLIWVDK